RAGSAAPAPESVPGGAREGETPDAHRLRSPPVDLHDMRPSQISGDGLGPPSPGGKRPTFGISLLPETGTPDAAAEGMKRILIGALATLAGGVIWIAGAYERDVGAARQRVSIGSVVVQTRCGPIEYAERGKELPVLVVHGAGGGFDQGLLLGSQLMDHGYRVIAMSRFGYLRTPMPADASAEAQAD